MKIQKMILRWCFSLSVTALTLLATNIMAAETNSIRLAIGPFFAPAGNAKLETAAEALPDLLMVSLSQENGFQLVEREKVNAIWNESYLTEAGLISADSVAELGRILSCDWLVSGSLIQTEEGAQIWIKIIDTQNGVVLDLQSLSYNPTNLSATVTEVAHFLAQARSRTHSREFIALGEFQDMSVSTTREDWSPRLAALIEKHLLAAGYGVVERETVAPIFSEYQFQAAGMTSDRTKRVKLKPAFWVVSGSWKWFPDSEDKLSVTINIQKMGGGQQMFSFSKPPGAELEKTIVETIQSALKETGSLTVEQAQAGEEKLRGEHAEELAEGRGEIWITSRFNTNPPTTSITVTDAYGGKRQVTVDPAWQAQKQSHAQEMVKTLQQGILLNSKDARSKYMLGMSMFGVTDATKSKQGEDLLEEVAKSGDPVYSIKAKNWLEDVRTGKISFQRDQFGNLNIVMHGQPASFSASASPNITIQQTAPINAIAVNSIETTNVAAKEENIVQIPSDLTQETSTDEQSVAEKRTEVLQQNFSKFVPVQFQKGQDSMAAIQYLHMKGNVFEYQGTYYCGFRFTVPEWIDGDFEWMYVLAKTEANKDFSTSTLSWYIIPKSGRSEGFDDYWSGGFSGYIFLKAEFQYTHILTTQNLDKDRLKPGQTYAIWFSFKEKDMPDIAFAMTIKSNRGVNEFGALPLR